MSVIKNNFMKYKIWIGFIVFFIFFNVGVVYCYVDIFWEGKIY